MITDYIAVGYKPLYTPFDYSFLPCREYIPLQEIEQPTPRLPKAVQIYREIVYLQDSDADEFITLLNEGGEASLIKCLVDYYDYGSGKKHTTPPWGANDRVFKDGLYVLAINFYIPYISLYGIE